MTTEQTGARDEYFVQISELCGKYFRTESLTLKRKCKDKVLEISYDPNVALQKRVEELEKALNIWSEADRLSPLQTSILTLPQRQFVDSVTVNK